MNRKTNTAKLVDFDLIRMTGNDGKVTGKQFSHNTIRHYCHSVTTVTSVTKTRFLIEGLLVTLVKCHLVTGVTVVTGSFI